MQLNTNGIDVNIITPLMPKIYQQNHSIAQPAVAFYRGFRIRGRIIRTIPTTRQIETYTIAGVPGL